MTLTPRQLRVLLIVRDFATRHGYVPTYEELGRLIRRHKLTAYEHVQELIGKGAIAASEGQSWRSYHLTLAGAAFLREWESHRRMVLCFLGEINTDGRTVPASLERDFGGRLKKGAAA